MRPACRRLPVPRRILHEFYPTPLTRQTGGKIALLLNLSSLCHPRRTALWQQNSPARIYAIDGVVCWPAHRYGPAPAAFTQHRYCWVVWSPEHQGAPSFGWLSAETFR